MSKITIILILTLIVGIGLFFHFYRFDLIPYGLNHDGAQDALQAISLLQHPLPYQVYLTGGSGETLFKYYLALMMGVMGISVWTAKFSSALFSFLTIPFFYFLAEKLTKNKYIALLSTFLLAVSGWNLIMGKTISRVLSIPLFEVATLYFLVRAVETKKYQFFALTGFFLTLTLHSYNAARSVLIFVLVVFAFALWVEKRFKQQLLTGILVFSFFFLITVYPLAKYAFDNWAEFNSRFTSESVLTKVDQGKNIAPLLENLKTAALVFNVRANGNDFFTTQPLLDQPTATLFLIGLVFCLLKIRRPENAFVIGGLVINLLPGLLSVPNGNRIMATLPFVYLIAGIGFYRLSELILKQSRSKLLISRAFVIFICLWAVYNTYSLYLGPNRRELWGFYPETTVVGNYMKPRLEAYDFYLADNYPRDALTFITYDEGDPFTKHYTWYENRENFLGVVPNENKGLIFVMFDNDNNLFFIERLRQKFPEGKLDRLRYVDNKIDRSAGLVFVVKNKLGL